MRLPECGDVFDGRFELQKVLGRGGMGTVFLALDRDMSRPVALKVLRPQRGGYPADTESRFMREARIIAQLSGPHTVTMYDFGRSADDLLYMVFEHVPGQDLSEIIASGRLDPATTTHILIQVLESLSEAHRAGLLHRDVKPENIRVFEDLGTEVSVKLLDFGIARHTDPTAPAITRTGELVGTPRYMSPEQLTDGVLTPASDIYSLGIVAIEMLMGGDGLQGNRWTDQLDRLASGHVFSLPELGRWGAGLAVIIGKMSARRPDDRYQSADAVLAALRALDARPAKLPAHAHSVDAPRPRRRPTTRERVTQTLKGIPRPVLALIAVGLAVAIGIPVAKIIGSKQSKPRVMVLRPRTEASPLIRPDTVADLGASAPIADGGTPPPDLEAGSNRDAENSESNAGCGLPAPFTGTGTLEAMDGVTSRRWVVHIPAQYDPQRAHPVVMLFHQDLQRPTEILGETRLHELADKEGFIIIAPDGKPPVAWKSMDTVDLAIDDLELTRKQLCIDGDKVFALGHGPGGRAAAWFRCLYPQLAALATTSYRLESQHPLCASFAPIPYLLLAPNKDGNAPIDGGQGCSIVEKVSLAEHQKTFRQVNACKGEPQVEFKHGTSTCQQWQCEAPFISCELDGGRGWPGSGLRTLGLIGGAFRDLRTPGKQSKDCDGQPPDFPFATKIWTFFEGSVD